MSLIDGEDERSYSTLNLFYFVLKFFFERKKKSSMNMPMNSYSAFRPTEIGVKMILSPRDITLSYEMSFNEFRFQLKEELCLLLDRGNCAVFKKKTRETHGKIMQKVYAKLWCCGLLFVTTSFWLKIYLFLTQFGYVHNSTNTLFVPSHNCVE